MTQPSQICFLVLITSVALLIGDQAIANKFETIGGGVSGSSAIKREWLQMTLAVAGGISLFSALLAIVLPHRNAAFLNYSNWKQSAIVLSILGVILVSGALLI